MLVTIDPAYTFQRKNPGKEGEPPHGVLLGSSNVPTPAAITDAAQAANPASLSTPTRSTPSLSTASVGSPCLSTANPSTLGQPVPSMLRAGSMLSTASLSTLTFGDLLDWEGNTEKNRRKKEKKKAKAQGKVSHFSKFGMAIDFRDVLPCFAFVSTCSQSQSQVSSLTSQVSCLTFRI